MTIVVGVFSTSSASSLLAARRFASRARIDSGAPVARKHSRSFLAAPAVLRFAGVRKICAIDPFVARIEMSSIGSAAE